jgi:hypothetical protein
MEAAAQLEELDRVEGEMRLALAETLRSLVADTRRHADAPSAQRAIDLVVDMWVCAFRESMLAASRAAVEGLAASAVATLVTCASGPQVAAGAQLQASLLVSLQGIVAATRAGRPDVDAMCARLAETLACERDEAIAAVHVQGARASNPTRSRRSRPARFTRS